MHKVIAAITLFFTACSVSALSVTLSATTEGGDRPVVVGKTNLPNDTELLIVLSRKESSYNASSKATVSGGAFRAGPFSQKRNGLNPGAYVLRITMPAAPVQPPSILPTLGRNGSKLSGPLVSHDEFFGNVVEFQRTITIGQVAKVPELDKAARAQSEIDKLDWVLQSCKEGCRLIQSKALNRNEPFSYDACFRSCVR
jgi:hypothetical protein